MGGNFTATEQEWGNRPFMIFVEESENPNEYYAVRFTDDKGEYCIIDPTLHGVSQQPITLGQALILTEVVKGIIARDFLYIVPDDDMHVAAEAIISNAIKGDTDSIAATKILKKGR